MLNAQFAACFKCVTTLNIRLQELTIHKHYFTATTYCLSFLFSYEIWNAFPFIYVSICTMKTFFEKNKKQKQDSQAFMRVNRLVVCYYSLRKLDWAEMAPCP